MTSVVENGIKIDMGVSYPEKCALCSNCNGSPSNYNILVHRTFIPDWYLDVERGAVYRNRHATFCGRSGRKSKLNVFLNKCTVSTVINAIDVITSRIFMSLIYQQDKIVLKPLWTQPSIVLQDSAKVMKLQ